jgi:glycosyltransferase involved in cell wall biosynthesis
MITVGFSTRNSNPTFIDQIRKTVGPKNVEIIQVVNDGEKSLTKVYNEILNQAKNDIVVLCHDDIIFEDKGWGNKLIKHFNKTNFGILGIAGTTSMPSSGMWWEERNKMLGIVNHKHEGKKWESKYSTSLGNDAEKVVIVDGLFMVIHKDRIKSNFIEDFDGFHFYDISFCFENYMKGVEIGVIYNIKITHLSIGQTNEKWEENKIKFAEKYADSLPVKLPHNGKRKLNVLISCLYFKNFTGSELYVYELARNLLNQNCNVTVVSDINGPLAKMAANLGVKVFHINEPPGFKIGDGVWGFNTQEGFKASEENKLYAISEVNYDVIHIQHKPIAERICQLYPNIPKVYTVHSEVISLEQPIIHPSIKKYISIRESISEYINKTIDIPVEDISVIYNPIDENRFNTIKAINENYLLFVGTIDYLREKTIRDLVLYTKEKNLELWLVGENSSNYLSELLNEPHVKHFKSTWNIEKYTKKCTETAGIMLGRTTIEGWMCGKGGWIYNVNDAGDILNKEFVLPPSQTELENKFFGTTVAKQIKEEYVNII